MAEMNIGEALKASGVSAKTIRHYELVGLVSAVARIDGGYRRYDESDVHTPRFIRQTRDLGFSIAEIAEIGELVALWHDRRWPSRQVKALAEASIQELEQKARALLAVKPTLEHLASRFHGDEWPITTALRTLGKGKGRACRRPSGIEVSMTRKGRSALRSTRRCGTAASAAHEPGSTGCPWQAL